LKSVRYRGLDLWIGSTLTLTQFSDRVVLMGSRKSLEAAIDRNLEETHTYSPLLISGARLAPTSDLWVVASELPDPLASIFVPLDLPAGSNPRNFEGGINLREGLDVGAIFDAGSEARAGEVAATIRKSIPLFPAVAKGLQVAASGRSVTLALHVGSGDLQASLRQPDTSLASQTPAVPPQPTVNPSAPNPSTLNHVNQASTTPRALSAPMALTAPAGPVTTTAPPSPKDKAAPPVAVSPAPAKHEPQIIRIYGLAEGTREIILPKEPR
jgi:hypothetical protein